MGLQPASTTLDDFAVVLTSLRGNHCIMGDLYNDYLEHQRREAASIITLVLRTFAAFKKTNDRDFTAIRGEPAEFMPGVSIDLVKEHIRDE